MAFDFKTKLLDVFANSTATEEQINDAIITVLEQGDLTSDDEQLEAMINLLVRPGNITPVINQEGAVGVTLNHNTNNESLDDKMKHLSNHFVDICPTYLLAFCQTHNNVNLEELVQELSQLDYVKLQKDPLDVWHHLKQMLPNADPTYLRNQARVLANRPEGELEQFIQNAVETSEYPTMQQYLINEALATEYETYIKNFSVSAFLMKVSNPVETFLDPNRKPVLSEDAAQDDLDFAVDFLYNQFPYQRKNEIDKIFRHFKRNLVKTCNKLKILPKAFRHPREVTDLKECKNVDLLQVVSFLKHEKQIKQFFKQKDEKYRTALEDARLNGLLQTCGCCFDDELIPEECYRCKKGCTFCKDCVRRGAEHVIGKEETVFPCLAACDSEFDYSTLQMVLDSNTFQKVWHRKQIEEVRKANLDGLETCPYCDFCMIPDEGDKIFRCHNIECMAETCRLCRHKAHIPLRCNEIEYDEDVKMRTFIENKMTEALLRKCWKCSKQFYKESGCNKMTCVCGALMCYLCGQAIQGYNHFGGNGCPLHTSNLQELHLTRVVEAAEAAKAELGIVENPDILKFDPTKNIERDVT